MVNGKLFCQIVFDLRFEDLNGPSTSAAVMKKLCFVPMPPLKQQRHNAATQILIPNTQYPKKKTGH